MNKHTKELGERLEKLLQWPGDVKIDTKVPDILQLLEEMNYQKVLGCDLNLEGDCRYCEPIEL